MNSVRLHKVEASGNDFLVGLAPLAAPLSTADIVAACDRHQGVGADGLIVIEPLSAGVLRFTLSNADGSVAETSGNGLRCAALVAHFLGLGDELSFVTDAGTVATVLMPRSRARAEVEVEMGRALVELEDRPMEGFRAARVDVGNPHLVLFEGPYDLVDLEVLGERYNEEVPGGVNVELVEVAGDDRLRLRVYERGVGLTLACGSGSVAAAAVLHLAERVGTEVQVENPGGTLRVALSPDGEGAFRARLSGDAHYIAALELQLDGHIGDIGHIGNIGNIGDKSGSR